MPMSQENRERARERMRAYQAAKREAQGLPPLGQPVADSKPEQEEPAADGLGITIPALMLEIELDASQLAALTLDSRCKGLSIHDTILAVINKAYGL